MSKPLNYIVLQNAVSITLHNGQNHVINSSHPNFNAIINNIKHKQWDTIEGLIDIPKAIAKASAGRVEVFQNEIRYNGLPVHSYLATRILTLMQQGFDIQPWVNFMEKLYTNPDPFSITQLYNFLERAKLPLTPDGDFLAYKYVDRNFKDCRTHTFDNSVGQTVTLDRAKCDNNPDNHCSSGLHFCAKGYLGSYGNDSNYHVVLVKVNPRDVVSIPNDHNCEKARACRYVVVGVLNEDYSFEDMEKSEVLPSPRSSKGVNKKNKTTHKNDQPSDLVVRILKSSAGTVRETAKNLGITVAEIVNNAGKWYTIVRAQGVALGAGELYATKAGRHWGHKNGVHNFAKLNA